MILAGYESFKFENTLIGALFSTAPDVTKKPKNEEEAKLAMLNTIAQRGDYSYSYSEYMWARLTRSFCCCEAARKSVRIAKLERHEKATAKLVEEIDILKWLSLQRIDEFTADMSLKKHQRDLISNYCESYMLSDLMNLDDKNAAQTQVSPKNRGN